MITTDQLDEIEARAKPLAEIPLSNRAAIGPNADFTRHAPDDVMALVAEVRRLRNDLMRIEMGESDPRHIALVALRPRQ